MHTVWEAQFFNSHLVTAMIVVIVIMSLVVVLFVKKYTAHTLLIRSVCVVVFLLTLSFLVLTLLSAVDDWKYAQNNQLLVEGIIEDYSTGDNGSDSFFVQNVYFWCTPIDNNLYAYTYTKRDPQCVIQGNGQYVRITYCVQNGLNCILKIETNDLK